MRELNQTDINLVYGGMVGGMFFNNMLRDFRDVVIMNTTQMATTVFVSAVTYALTESPAATFAGALAAYVGGYAITNGYIIPHLDQLDQGI